MRTCNWNWNFWICNSQLELAGKCWYQWKGMALLLPGLRDTDYCSTRQALQGIILGWIYPWAPKTQSVLQYCTQNFWTLFALTSTYHSSLSSPLLHLPGPPLHSLLPALPQELKKDQKCILKEHRIPQWRGMANKHNRIWQKKKTQSKWETWDL